MSNTKEGLWKSEEGATIVGVWLTALTAIFCVITVYTLTYDLIMVKLYNIAILLAPDSVDGGYFGVLTTLRTIWEWIPWIIVFGILLWVFANTQRMEYEEGL
jgi:hypothetical protein